MDSKDARGPCGPKVVRIPQPTEQELNRIRREAGLVKQSTVPARAGGRDTNAVWNFPVRPVGRPRKDKSRRRARPNACYVERG